MFSPTLRERGLYLLKRAGAKAKHEEDVIVGYEGRNHADYNHRPLAEQEDRLATEMIGQRRETHCTKHHSDG